MKTIVLSLILLASVNAAANDLCPPVQSEGEGHWPIPEDEFTQEAAQKSAKKLEKIMAELSEGQEYFAKKYAIDYESLVFNELIFIKGYTLKLSAKTALNNDAKFAKHSVDEFCSFLKNEASVWH